MARSERARHWRYGELPGVDLLRARYVEKRFVRHTHENFMIAAIADGVEVFHHGGADQYAGPEVLALVNPDTAHTGRAGEPEGWRYGAVYPSPELVAETAAETTLIRGTPGFSSPVLEDPYAAGLVHEVLRAADEGNALVADTLLRVAVTRLLRLNGGPLPQRAVRTAGPVRRPARVPCWRSGWSIRRLWSGSLEAWGRVLSPCCGRSGTFTGCRRTRG